MNDALALSRGFEVPSLTETLKAVARQFAFLQAPSKESAKTLTVSAEETVKNISLIRQRIISEAIATRTEADFAAHRTAKFSDYVKAIRTISDYASLVMSKSVLAELAAKGFTQLEADFTARGDAAFGRVARDQAIFTLWTFRKIEALLRSKVALKDKNISSADHEADRQLGMECLACVLWTRFHFDCLAVALASGTAIYPEVRDVVVEGLRSAVNAYAYAKRSVRLHVPVQEPVIAPIEWDDEDRFLLASSMRDMRQESLE
jgi:hypothetical protein